jgi:hypothetical protein
MSDLEGAIWRTSSRSGSEGNCVEVADNLPGIVAVRDSKNRAGGTLVITTSPWVAFISGVKAGEFDR